MSKHKKTRKEKKLSDMRKSSTLLSTPSTGPNSLPTFSFTSYKMTAAAYPSAKSENISHGLEKTLIVSSIIVILQLAFFFLLTHHMLVLPFKIIQY